MRVANGSLLAFLLASSALAQPPEVVIVPPGPPVPAVKWVPVSGEAKVSSDIVLSAGVKSEWALIDTGPTLRVSADGMTATIRSEVPGTFRLLVIPDNGRPQFRTITIGGPGPLPPGPNPLRDRLRVAFDTDAKTDPAARDEARDLAALYKQAALLAESPDVPTSGELLRRVREAASVLIGPNAMPTLRKAVALELASVLTDDAPLTADQRRDLAKLFRDIAAALEGF